MRRRALLARAALGIPSAALALGSARLARAQEELPSGASVSVPPAGQPLVELDPDAYAPVTPRNPRVWPAAVLPEGLALGAVDTWQAPRRATEAGVRWSRVQFSWRDLQRKGPDDWSGSWLENGVSEAAVNAEIQAGRRLVGLLARTPAWAATGPTRGAGDPPLGLALSVDDPGNGWARYVSAAVARYAGRIDDWIIWNEPDVWSDETRSRQWTGSVEQYYQLLKTGYLAAKRVNPSARVWMAGLTYWWDYLYGREQYFASVLRLALEDPSAAANNWYFDGAVVQLYNDPRGLFDVPRVFQRIQRNLLPPGTEAKPVWVNEMNVVPWDDPVAPLSRAHYRATMDEQASYLVQALCYALASGTDHVAVFKWVDDESILRNVEQAFGMLRFDADRSPRPVYEAFRAAQTWLAPTRRAQLVDEGPVVKVLLEQPELGRRVTVAWSRVGQPQEMRLALLGPTASVIDKFGRTRASLTASPDGSAALTLPPATANTLPGFPNDYFVGGDPMLIAEPLPDSYQPLPVSASLPKPPLQMDPADVGPLPPGMPPPNRAQPVSSASAEPLP